MAQARRDEQGRRIARPDEAVVVSEATDVARERAELEDPEYIECECNSPDPLPEGETTRKWGMDWRSQGEDGKFRCVVHRDFVKGGMEAGRYKPVNISDNDAGDIYWRAQYREMTSKPPPADMDTAEIRAFIRKKHAAAAKRDYLEA